jgi:phospholipid transport system substrate-binding protein
MQVKIWIKQSVWCAVLSWVILSQTAAADDKFAAEEFLKSKLETVFSVLQKQDLDQQEKNQEIIEIVTPLFDFALMAKLSLGRKHWPSLTQEKREKFTQLFVKRLRQSYMNRLTAYTDEKVIYEPPVEVKKKIQIPTRLISKDKKISMLYKLYKSKNSWKVYDMEIQGVSIIRSYRSQFNEILQNGTMDDLLKKMEKPIDN